MRGLRAEELLEGVDLAVYGSQMPDEKSDGEKQGVALTRAVAHGLSIMRFQKQLKGLDYHWHYGIPKERLEVLRDAVTAVLIVTDDPGA